MAAVLADVQQDKEKLSEVYGKLLTDNGVSLNAMDIMRVHEGKGMETMIKLFADYDVDRIKLNGFKHDLRAVSSPYISWEFSADTQADMQKTGSPELPGTLTSVEISRYEWAAVPRWWSGHATSEVFKDKYGNTVMVETTSSKKEIDHPGEPDEVYSQSITIMAPTNFLSATGSEATHVSWSVDLSKIGIPEMTDLVYSNPESPVAVKEAPLGNKFNFYYEGDDNQVKKVFGGFYDAAIQGVMEMQYAFYGYSLEQQIIKNILIKPSNEEKNGFFAPRDSATIALTDEHMNLLKSDYGEVISTSRHESSHALFNYLELASNISVNELHKRLSPDFFKAIAESNWVSDGFGGHAQDNATELFASFMNGLMIADLETTMRTKLTPATAAEYADTAKVFHEALKKPLTTQNDRYETISILKKLADAEKIARSIAAGK